MTDAFQTSAPSPVLPFDRAYWVLPGRLLAGYVPVKPDPAGTRPQLRALLGQGIRQFVSLMPAAPEAAPAVRPQALSPTARHRR